MGEVQKAALRYTPGSKCCCYLLNHKAIFGWHLSGHVRMCSHMGG